MSDNNAVLETLRPSKGHAASMKSRFGSAVIDPRRRERVQPAKKPLRARVVSKPVDLGEVKWIVVRLQSVERLGLHQRYRVVSLRATPANR